MITVLDTPIALGTGATALILVAGVVNLLRDGPNRATRSNMLMRGRIAAQAIAVALIMAGFAFKQHSAAESRSHEATVAAAQDLHAEATP